MIQLSTRGWVRCAYSNGDTVIGVFLFRNIALTWFSLCKLWWWWSNVVPLFLSLLFWGSYVPVDVLIRYIYKCGRLHLLSLEAREGNGGRDYQGEKHLRWSAGPCDDPGNDTQAGDWTVWPDGSVLWLSLRCPEAIYLFIYWMIAVFSVFLSKVSPRACRQAGVTVLSTVATRVYDARSNNYHILVVLLLCVFVVFFSP